MDDQSAQARCQVEATQQMDKGIGTHCPKIEVDYGREKAGELSQLQNILARMVRNDQEEHPSNNRPSLLVL